MHGILCTNKAQFNRKIFYAIYRLLQTNSDFFDATVADMVCECVVQGLLFLENSEFQPDYREIASKFNATFKFTPLTKTERANVTDKESLGHIRRKQMARVTESLGESDIESLTATQIRLILKTVWKEEVTLMKTKRESDFIESCGALYDDIVRDR